MTAILKPHTGDDLVVNWWKWRPTVAALVRAGILPEGERSERCLANGCGGYLTQQEAKVAAKYIGSLLEQMRPHERIMLEGGMTSNERRTLHMPVTEWNENDRQEIYSGDTAWLATFRDFCSRSGGFTVV